MNSSKNKLNNKIILIFHPNPNAHKMFDEIQHSDLVGSFGVVGSLSLPKIYIYIYRERERERERSINPRKKKF